VDDSTLLTDKSTPHNLHYSAPDVFVLQPPTKRIVECADRSRIMVRAKFSWQDHFQQRDLQYV